MSGTRIGWQLALPILDEIGQILTALGGVVYTMEVEERTGHNDGLQMRRSEMGDTPQYLALYAWRRYLRRYQQTG